MDTQEGTYFRVSRYVQVVRLSVSVRMMADLHNCNNNCRVSLNKIFKHASNILYGGTWKTIGQGGFPRIWANGHGVSVVA